MATKKSPIYIKAKDIAELVLAQKLVARFHMNDDNLARDTFLLVEVNLDNAGSGAACEFIKRNCASLALDYIEARPKPSLVVFAISFRHTAGLSARVLDVFTGHNFQKIDSFDDLITLTRGVPLTTEESYSGALADFLGHDDVVDATKSCTDVPHSTEGNRDTARELGLVAPGDVVVLLSAPDFNYTVVADVDGSVILAYKAESGDIKLTQAPLAVLAVLAHAD